MKIMQSKGINYRSVALFIYRHFALPPEPRWLLHSPYFTRFLTEWALRNG